MRNISFINLLILPICLLASSCQAQSAKNADVNAGSPARLVGGPCDGCEIMWVGMPANLRSSDTSKGWNEAGQKLVISGKVYRKDGRTPAPGVTLYYWQTDNNGY